MAANKGKTQTTVMVLIICVIVILLVILGFIIKQRNKPVVIEILPPAMEETTIPSEATPSETTIDVELPAAE